MADGLARTGLVLAGAWLIGTTGVRAADLPLRSPPIAPVPYFAAFSWTGIYAGVQAGYDWDHDRLTEVLTANQMPTGFVFNPRPDGFAGGGHVGADYQFQSFVVGAVADFEGTTDRGTFDGSPVGKGHDTVPWQGSVRGRLGYAFGNALIFATGGFAFARIESTYVNLAPPTTSETFSKTGTGWTVGGGLAYALTDHWVASAEYRYSAYGRIANVSTVAFPGLTGKTDYDANAVRIGVSYKF